MPEASEWYVPVEREGAAGNRATSLHFMLHALLSSRIETGMSSDDRPNEEDVNVYLAHLLCEYARPQYHERVHRYLSDFDSSIFQRVSHSKNNRLAYTVYKANADHTLLMMGLFQNGRGKRPSALPAPLRLDDTVHLGRGKAYYDFAFTYSRSLFGHTSGIATVLCKLSSGFEEYVRLLTHARSEYFNFIDHMSEGELFHLQRSVLAQDLPALHDAFLDAFSEWRRDPTPEKRARLAESARAIEKLEPSFQFKLPEA